MIICLSTIIYIYLYIQIKQLLALFSILPPSQKEEFSVLQDNALQFFQTSGHEVSINSVDPLDFMEPSHVSLLADSTEERKSRHACYDNVRFMGVKIRSVVID